jgi:hypothetical protein
MNIDKEKIFLHLWKRHSDTIEDIEKLKLLEEIIDTYLNLFYDRKVTKIQLLEDVLSYSVTEENNLQLYRNFDQNDILLMSLGLLPKRYMFDEQNNDIGDYESVQLIESILHKCFDKFLFEGNIDRGSLKDCIVNELGAFSEIRLQLNESFDDSIDLSLLEDITGAILSGAKALGKILLKFGIPLAAIAYLLKYIYERGKYNGYKTLAEILEKRGEDLNTLAIKVFIHCINLEKELNKQYDPKQLIKTCEKNTYTVLSQMNKFFEDCLTAHDEDICYERFQKHYKDILNIFDTLISAKEKNNSADKRKGGSK